MAKITIYGQTILLPFLKVEKNGQKPSLLTVEYAQIAALHEERFLEKQIAKRLQFRKSSVHRVTKKFKNHGTCGDLKKTAVGPTKLHDEKITPSEELLCDPLLVFVINCVPSF